MKTNYSYMEYIDPALAMAHFTIHYYFSDITMKKLLQNILVSSLFAACIASTGHAITVNEFSNNHSSNQSINFDIGDEFFKVANGMKTWVPTIQYTSGNTSACRTENDPPFDIYDSRLGAAYCPGSNTILMERGFFIDNSPTKKPTKAFVRAISAHELGHAANWRLDKYENHDSTFEGEQLADCVVGGYSQNSNDKAALDHFVKCPNNVIEASDSHGTPMQRVQAAREGKRLGSPGKCLSSKRFNS